MIDRESTGPPTTGQTQDRAWPPWGGEDLRARIQIALAQAAALIPGTVRDPLLVLDFDTVAGRLSARSGARTPRGDQRRTVPTGPGVHEVWSTVSGAVTTAAGGAARRIVIDVAVGVIAAWTRHDGDPAPDTILAARSAAPTFLVPADIDVVYAPQPPAQNRAAWARIVYLCARYGVADMGESSA